MLPRGSRLKRQEITRVIARGHSFYQPGLALRLRRLPTNQEPSRLALVVPAKVVKKTVWRNKIKRQWRAIIIKNLKNLVPGWASVIFVKEDIRKLPFKEFEAQLLQLLAKAGLIRLKNE